MYHLEVWEQAACPVISILAEYKLLYLLLSDFTEFFIYWRTALLLKDQSKKIFRYR